MNDLRILDSEPSPEIREGGKLVVVCETWNGRATKPSLELLGEARRLLSRFSQYETVDAVVFGDMEKPGATLGAIGAGKVWLCSSPVCAYNHDMVLGALETFVRSGAPSLFLFAHTLWGAEIAARLAAKLEAPMISNCVEALAIANNALSALQSIQDGRLHRECSIVFDGPAIISWNPDALGPAPTNEVGATPVEELDTVAISTSQALRSLRIIEGDPDSILLEEADSVVAFGRGMDPADLPGLRELAAELSASLGGTRPVIDAGLLPFERQIGLTGVSISPKLLMTWGVSGADEFTVGVEEADSIISVNTDPRARIFTFSDLGLVGDGKAVLRLLSERLKSDAAETGSSLEDAS